MGRSPSPHLITQIELGRLDPQCQSDQKAIDDINKQIYSINSFGINVPNFSGEALWLYDWNNPGAVTEYIIKCFVATGAIGYDDACALMRNSLDTAQEGERGTKDIKLLKQVSIYWSYIKGSYKDNLINQKHGLSKQFESDKFKRDIQYQKCEDLQAESEKAKSALLNEVSLENQATVNAQLTQNGQSNDKALWEAIHPAENVKYLLSIVGQPWITLEAANANNYIYMPSDRYNSNCRYIAKCYVDYKYLFLTPSSPAQRDKEEQNLSAKFQGKTLTSESLHQEKLRLDEAIGQGMVQEAVALTSTTLSPDDPTFAETVVGNLISRLGYVFPLDSLTSLSIDITQDIKANDYASAGQKVTQTLQTNAYTVSVESYGTYTPPQQVSQPTITSQPPEKKKRHGFKKWAHKVGNGLMEGVGIIVQGMMAQGVGVQVGTGKTKPINIGIQGYENHQIYQFKPQTELIFTPIQQQLSQNLFTPQMSFIVPNFSLYPFNFGNSPQNEQSYLSREMELMWDKMVDEYVSFKDPSISFGNYFSEAFRNYKESSSAPQKNKDKEKTNQSSQTGKTKNNEPPSNQEDHIFPNTNYVPQDISTNQRSSSIGTKLLDFFIPKAEANPAALAIIAGEEVGGYVLGGLAAGGLVAGLMQNEDDGTLKNATTTYPVNDSPTIYTDLGKKIGNALDSGSSTTTITNQPKLNSDPYTFPEYNQTNLLMFNTFKYTNNNLNNERRNGPDRDKKYIQPPKLLPGFSDAKRARGKTPYPGGVRTRWKNNDGKILEWDGQHGEVEMYDKTGKHLGAYDPNTGEQIKGPKRNRNIKKYI